MVRLNYPNIASKDYLRCGRRLRFAATPQLLINAPRGRTRFTATQQNESGPYDKGNQTIQKHVHPY
jgi:hypothetical protein